MATILPVDPIGKGSKLISLAELKNYPQFASDGVYILATDGKLYDPNSWVPDASGYVAVGVAVIDGSFRYVIAPESANKKWGGPFSGNKYVAIAANLVTTGSSGDEGMFYSGSLKESSFMATFSPAANYCINYKFKNGKYGYLPSIGQLMNAYSKATEIHDAFTKIGVTKKLLNSQIWSSTIEMGFTNLSGSLNNGFGTLLLSYGSVYTDTGDIEYSTIPFCDL